MSTAQIVVIDANDPLTTIVGFVEFEDGLPAGGAEISILGLPNETATFADGSYVLPGVPTFGVPDYTIRAETEVAGETFLGTAADVSPVPDGLTDAGVIVLGETGGFGPIIVSGMDPEDHGSSVGGAGWQMIQDIVFFVVENSALTPDPGKIAHLGGSSSVFSITQSAVTPLGYTIDHIQGTEILAVDFLNYDCVYMPTASADISGGLSQTELGYINQRGPEIIDFVNAGGGLAAFAQNLSGGFEWFPLGGLDTVNLGAGGSTGITVTKEGAFILSPSATAVEPFHQAFVGPPGFFGLDVLALESGGQQRPLIIGGLAIIEQQ